MSTERSRPRAGSLAGGLVLVLIGIVFLLANLGVVRPTGNWWAAFILIPVVALLATSWSRYRATGAFTPSVSWTLTAALYPLAVALILLLDLDWTLVWPVFPIIAGVSLLLGSVARRSA